MPRPLLPTKYINVPAGIVYDRNIPPAVLSTYVQLRGLAWGDEETPEVGVRQLLEITGKSRATLYGHLAILRASGWLLFSSAHHSGLTFRFVSDAAHETLSKNLDLLNEDVNLTDTKIVKHPPVNQKNRAGSVQNSGQVSKNLDSNNGWHEKIDAELERVLERVGVFPEKYRDVAASGWTCDQIRRLAEVILDEFGPKRGGGVFLYRLINREPPKSEADLRRDYVSGDWGHLVEH